MCNGRNIPEINVLGIGIINFDMNLARTCSQCAAGHCRGTEQGDGGGAMPPVDLLGLCVKQFNLICDSSRTLCYHPCQSPPARWCSAQCSGCC